ncbi:MAG TPA: hypothetical protein VLW45_12005 [Pelomicrobium sp.]|nr:hypothetical protein [Pelomicrobium sp.]
MYHVKVVFGKGEEYELRLSAEDVQPLSAEEAHRWLDAELGKAGEEVFNPVGKALAVDKLLNLARAVGPGEFKRQTPWARELARCAAALLDRPNVTIDIGKATVGF